MESLVKFLAEAVILFLRENYKERPKTTVAGVTIFLILLIGLVVTANYLEKQKISNIEISNLELKEKVTRINQIQNSLKELDNFLEDQEQSIQNQQITLEKLKKENNQIEPIVEANRAIIDKIFLEQERRGKWDLWIGLGIGFLLGIPASFVASLLYDYYKSKK